MTNPELEGVVRSCDDRLLVPPFCLKFSQGVIYQPATRTKMERVILTSARFVSTVGGKWREEEGKETFAPSFLHWKKCVGFGGGSFPLRLAAVAAAA